MSKDFDKKPNNKIDYKQEQQEPRAAKSLKEEKRLMDFDVYFLCLMKRESRILPHHKAPMKKYAEQNGLNQATEEEFDKVFKLY